MKIVYPACIYPCEEGGYTIIFPDLKGCITEGDDLAEAILMAQNALGGWVAQLIQDKEQLPVQSNIKDVVSNEYENGFVSLIMVDVDNFLSNDSLKAIKKTLTIPRWLNEMAENNCVNFSQVLQKALIKHLGLD